MSNQNIELTGRIVTPGNPEYNSAREEFNTFSTSRKVFRPFNSRY
ncbi:hypothetical protein Bmyc01_55460 [Bacillus mycoides]|nr:hypothetical protein Bmyc01_55460 [Bacillus mycoides]